MEMSMDMMSITEMNNFVIAATIDMVAAEPQTKNNNQLLTVLCAVLEGNYLDNKELSKLKS